MLTTTTIIPLLALCLARQGSGDLPGEQDFNRCSRVSPDEPTLKLTIKPQSEVADVIGWANTVSCAKIVTTNLDLRGKKVTVKSPGLLSRREAYRLFVEALGTVGLTIQPVEETSQGRQSVVLKVGPKS